MEPIRFIHTADIHLGSQLKSIGIVSGKMQGRLRRATFTAFNRIVDAAIKYQVDFVLFAGDVYDLESRSIHASRYLAEQLERLNFAGIEAYIIAGNHDPMDETRVELVDLPANSHVFGSENVDVKEVQRDGNTIARIVGQSYRGQSDSRSMATYFTVNDASVWNIGLLHTALDPQNNKYVPVVLEKLLEQSDIHYWALGHIHKQQLVRQYAPTVAYPGNPQGRDVGESGLKGCLLVELEPEKEPDIQFVPTGSILWLEHTVSIDDAPESLLTIDDLVEFCADSVENMLEKALPQNSEIPLVQNWNRAEIDGYIVRWTIRGRGEIHEQLIQNRMENAKDVCNQLRKRLDGMSPFIWTESVLIETGKPIPEMASLEAESEIFAEVREIFTEIADSDSEYAEMLENLGKIWETDGDSESLDPRKFMADGKTVQDMLQEAKRRIVEAIYEYRENA